MKVFKFGGASVNSIDRIKNVGNILQKYTGQKLLVVISAMGKTTNALEKVVEAFYNNKKEESLLLFEQVKQQHLTTAKYLLVTNYLACENRMKDFFTEVEWLLHDKPVREFDYYYDQVVCIGELLSTAIISNYLNAVAVKNKWVDVRDIIRTDDNFRDAKIDWAFTNSRVQNAIVPLFNDYDLVITQGFIGLSNTIYAHKILKLPYNFMLYFKLLILLVLVILAATICKTYTIALIPSLIVLGFVGFLTIFVFKLLDIKQLNVLLKSKFN